MIWRFVKQLISIALSFVLVVIAAYDARGQQPTPTGTNGYSGQDAPLSADELQQLVAPIALYPDALQPCRPHASSPRSEPRCVPFAYQLTSAVWVATPRKRRL